MSNIVTIISKPILNLGFFATAFKRGDIIEFLPTIGDKLDSPYSIVTDGGLVNLTTGHFYPFDMVAGFRYRMVTETLQLERWYSQ